MFGRHHSSIGEVYNPGGRYRKEETVGDKKDVSKVRDHVTKDQLIGYMNRMQPFMNATVRAAFPHYYEELKQQAEKIQKLWGRSMSACFSMKSASTVIIRNRGNTLIWNRIIMREIVGV